MNKKLLILLLIIFPLKIEAYCTNQESTRYKSLSSQINSYYEFDEATKKYNITIYNVKDELLIRNTKTFEQYINTSNQINEIVIYNQNPGESITYGVYPIGGNCNDYRMRTIYINLPHYNQYYQDPICNNNTNQLCSRYANTTAYTYEQFVEQVKSTSKVEEQEVVKKEKEKKKYGFFDFLEDYYIYILLIIIASGIFAIYKLDKKNKFDF